MTTTVVPCRVELVEQLDDRGARGGVEVARRLVGQQQRRVADDGAGDRDPLAFAAGELVRAVAVPVCEADAVERAPCPPAALRAGDAGVEQAVRDVVHRGHAVGEVELLEHEPDPVRPQRRQCPVVEVVDVEAVDAGDAEVGRSSVPMMFSSVDLPEPLGPTMATSSPAAIVSETPAHASTGGSP